MLKRGYHEYLQSRKQEIGQMLLRFTMHETVCKYEPFNIILDMVMFKSVFSQLAPHDSVVQHR